MSILHTVNKSPFEKNSLRSCIEHALQGSAVLLIEDGVYGAINNTAIAETVKKAMENIAVYALKSDIDARGINQDHLIDKIELVDYSGFVKLATEHDKVQSWL